MLQIKGPRQVMDCLGCLVSVAGALGGAIACGQRLAGVPGEERVPVLRLRGAVKTFGRAVTKPAVMVHEARLSFCMHMQESTGSKAAEGKCKQTAHEAYPHHSLHM